MVSAEEFRTQAEKIIGNYLTEVPVSDRFGQLLLISNALDICVTLCYQSGSYYNMPYTWIYDYAKYHSDYYGLTKMELIDKFNGHKYTVPSGTEYHSYQAVSQSLVDIANTLGFQFY